MSRLLKAALAALTLLAFAVGVQVAGDTVAGAQQAQGNLVNEVPAAFTPQVKNGQVESITQTGTTMVLGGTFTSVTPSGGSPTYTRQGIVAFNATTGAINTAFNPTLDGSVATVEAGPTTGTVYVGGNFTNVNGVRSKGVALLNVADGTMVSTWKVVGINGLVEDLVRVGNRLYLGGRFTSVGNTAHGGVATLNATTGALDPFLGSTVSGHHNYNGSGAQAAVGVENIAVSPDGTKLVAIGNFKQVDGLDRDQAVMFDLTGAQAAVKADWRTHRYEPACFNWAFDSYIRDVDFAPDGSYFVIVATGGPNPGTLCDTAARWESTATGDDVQPTWIDDTGGDTLFSVSVTGTAVYVGGHQRWQNNAGGTDSPAAGSVPRPGLAALDPKSGVPFSWNAARNPRGAGAFALYASTAGLWVGSDTSYIGNLEYWRPRIAFFPLTGGKTAGPGNPVGLPSNVYLGAPAAGAGGAQIFRVNAGGPTLGALDDGPDWLGDESADSPYRNSGSSSAGWGPGATISASVPASTPPAIFDSERWDSGSKNDGGEMHWSFPEPAGTQVEVRLYFANRCGCTNFPGGRVFDVDLDGTKVLDDYDMVASQGDQVGVMKSYTVTSDGSIDLDWSHEAENPLVNGIEVIPAGVTPPATTLVRRYYDGTAAGAASAGPANGPAWNTVRGAVMVDGTLFYGRTDGQFYRRTFDGTAFGAETLIDPYNDPKWSDVNTGSGQTFRGRVPTLYGTQMSSVTAFAFSGGRLYYTASDRSGLYYRPFNPESGIMGPEATVPGVTMPQVNGMFVVGSSFYYVEQSTGNLHRTGFSAGAPSGADTVVSGPGTDGVDWRARTVFLGPGPMPNQAPAAAFTQNCSGLTCTFSGATSTDSDGTITSYAWQFGDGGTATGSTASHTFAAGTYSVRLTVTDNDNATGTTVMDVTVAPPPASPISFVGAAKANVTATTASVQVPAGTAAGDGQLLFVTQNDTAVAVSAPAGLSGWQLVGQPASATMRTSVYQRVATAGDAGATVSVTAGSTTKIALELAVYHGTAASGPVAAWTSASDANTASHASPSVDVPAGGNWVATFWADKSSTTTAWTAPSSVTTRDVSLSTGSGRVTSLLADSGGAVGQGTYGNLLASTNAASSRGLSVSLVLDAQ